MSDGAHAELLEHARAIVSGELRLSLLAGGESPRWLGADWENRPGVGAYIDHTLLKPESTQAQVIALCEEAERFGLRAVCVNGIWVEISAERLAGTGILVAAVAAFPLGAMDTKAKVEEARLAVLAGASEIDMVLSLGRLKAGDWTWVEDDIRAVVDAAGSAGVKVILETAALDALEIAAACLVSRAAGAAFVKTSTGFHAAGGASRDAVALMRAAVGFTMGVKASGGIRTAEAALGMLAVGANRIGSSSAVAMGSYLGPGAPRLGDALRGMLDSVRTGPYVHSTHPEPGSH
jgi:deoxyribose-phosphate aldolase